MNPGDFFGHLRIHEALFREIVFRVSAWSHGKRGRENFPTRREGKPRAKHSK